MHLIYLDESGNTGMNLNDSSQPVFVLSALIVPEADWQGLESDLKKSLDSHFPDWRDAIGFEVHGADLRHGTGAFKGVSVKKRVAFRDEWMQIAVKHELRIIFRSVDKKRFSAWLKQKFGDGVVINPHVVAFEFLARCVENYLASLPGKPLGMLISDENREIVADIEKSIALFRDEADPLRLTRIIEKGFFIDSKKSLPLQLCDLFALAARKVGRTPHRFTSQANR